MADHGPGATEASNLPEWNLTDLYCGHDDPAIAQDLQKMLEMARAFEATWRDKVAGEDPIAPEDLAKAIEQFEQIAELMGKVASFATLLHAADTSRHEHGALLGLVQDRLTQVRQHLLFFELELMDLPDDTAESLLASSALERWRGWIRKVRRFCPHRLSEPEERLVDVLANTGQRAWKRLFDETIASMQFRVKLDGQVQTLTESQALSLLYEPDRNIRRAAARAITETLRSHARHLAYILNTLLWDHEIEDRLRRFEDPMDSRNLENEVDRQTVEALLQACEQNYATVQRYYELKRRLLDLDELKDYDRYAPVADEAVKVDFEQCRQFVLESFGGFDERFKVIARQFFERGWIDAAPRPGKVGGAFCAATTAALHPYVLCNYTGRLRDVLTVAHELGHGVHQYLSRRVGYLQMRAPLILAETASVFGEMLTFEKLLESQADPTVRLALLCGKIEDIFATVFRQVVLTRFEQQVHNLRRKQGEISVEQICQIWLDANRPMHGTSVVLTDDYGWWWAYISHFFHVPFYCYAYAFGELLVLALYNMYRTQGQQFVPQYMEMLCKGGSQSPAEILQPLGVDITDGAFWQQGLAEIARLVDQAEQMAAEAGK